LDYWKRASTGRPTCIVQSGAALIRPSIMPVFGIPTARTRKALCRYSAAITHLCAPPAIVLIRSARISSKPRYFPHFSSCHALCASRRYSSPDATDWSCATTEWGLIPEQCWTQQWTGAPRPLLFPHRAELECTAHLCSLLQLRLVGHHLKHH
jgi:hypothetical protein